MLTVISICNHSKPGDQNMCCEFIFKILFRNKPDNGEISADSCIKRLRELYLNVYVEYAFMQKYSSMHGLPTNVDGPR